MWEHPDKYVDHSEVADEMETRPSPRRWSPRERMTKALPDGLVEGHESLIEELHLPDPKGRHVLAAAIKSGAQVIVTRDKDFTQEDRAPWDIEAKTPDEFVLDQIDICHWGLWLALHRCNPDSSGQSRRCNDLRQPDIPDSPYLARGWHEMKMTSVSAGQRAPAIGLEPITYRLTAGRSAD